MKKRMIVYTPLLFARRLSRKLWVRVAGMAVLAALVSVATVYFEHYLPDALRERFVPKAVTPVLTILASGMLAVSTFSLNVMVSAYRAAGSQVTPRAHRILLEDTTTQTVLSIFIGAFVYALSALILLNAGLHSEGSAVISLGVTVGVVVLVIGAMVRWIDHLSDLGSMDATLRRIEAETRESLIRSRASPTLGARPLTSDTLIPPDATTLLAPDTGYVQMINMSRISKLLEGDGAYAWLTCRPGHFIREGVPIGHVSGLDEAGVAKLQKALTIGDVRSFEQDPQYGLLVMSETASRALSPGINDPGTAIDVITRLERLLWNWAHNPPEDDTPPYAQIFVADVDPATLIENAFAGTARDGAGMTEVVQQMLSTLQALQDSPEPRLAQGARDLAERVRMYAEAAMVLKLEKEAVAKG